MTFSVTLLPSRKHFQASPEESLLEAGLRQGVGLPHGCRTGVCGACKVKVTAGEFDHGAPLDDTLKAAERAAGYALLCCASARSDLSIECREIGGTDDYPIKTLPTRVEEMRRLAADVMRLKLKLPSNENFRFRPGQYIDILLKDGQRRGFSMANAPHDNAFLELHLRHVPGGVFTGHVFSGMKERDILRINGPHGSFFLHEDSAQPIILIAGGTGFAPVKSIVEHAIHAGSRRPMHIYWGARGRADLYLDELPRAWANQLPFIRYTPVLSDSLPADAWTGRTGLVHQAVIDDYADLSGHQVYACGAPAMIDVARQACCQQRQLPAAAFFSDAFSYAAAAAT